MSAVPALYVQFGCGFSAPSGWRNFDASPTLRYERVPVLGRLYTRNAARFPGNVEYGDVLRGLPVATGSCAGVYASHVLEHLALDDFHVALRETFRILRPGGIFRLVVPDLYDLCRRYVAAHDAGDAEASHAFMHDSHLGESKRPRGLGGVARAWMGNSDHRWMWDEASLRRALNAHGFVSVRRAEFGDAGDPAFALVENRDRFQGACAMEGLKPAAEAEQIKARAAVTGRVSSG